MTKSETTFLKSGTILPKSAGLSRLRPRHSTPRHKTYLNVSKQRTEEAARAWD